MLGLQIMSPNPLPHAEDRIKLLCVGTSSA
jgi:hypothetical protein